MKLLTLAEAAEFLRVSRSNLYQRKDIPRYRRPGSRVLLFDQDELETWLKQGRINCENPNLISRKESKARSSLVDVLPLSIYHRNARYR